MRYAEAMPWTGRRRENPARWSTCSWFKVPHPDAHKDKCAGTVWSWGAEWPLTYRR